MFIFIRINNSWIKISDSFLIFFFFMGCYLSFTWDYSEVIILTFRKINCYTVKPLITNTSKEFIKCRILHFLSMECCRYIVFLIK